MTVQPVTVQPVAVDRQQASRRKKWIVVAVALVVVLAVGGYWFIGWPKIGPSTVTNKSGAVSLNVPAGWTATTSAW